jgi:signal peptidase I
LATKLEDVDFLFSIETDTMLPSILRGDLLLCKKIDADDIIFQKKDSVYVIQTAQETLVRRIKKSENKDFLVLFVDNDLTDPIEIAISKISMTAFVKNSIRFMV